MARFSKKSTFVIIGIGSLFFFIAFLFQSCEGCSKTPSDVNVDIKDSGKAGSASVSLSDLNRAVSSSVKEYINVSFSGTLITAGEGTGQTSFTTQKTCEVTSSNVSPVPAITRYNLKPGNWQITVSAKTWSASCTKVINPKTATSFNFTYGQSNCK
jgi:hypothetical protein